MRFRKGVRLDPSQVEDFRGRGARMPGTPIAIGGGGIVTLLVVLAFVLLGGNLGSGSGPLTDLAGESVSTQEPGAVLSECQTGADANEREDCRILAVVNGNLIMLSDVTAARATSRTRQQECA